MAHAALQDIEEEALQHGCEILYESLEDSSICVEQAMEDHTTFTRQMMMVRICVVIQQHICMIGQ